MLSALLDGGSYLLDFYASDSVIGGVPSGTGNFSSSYDVRVQFAPIAAVPIPAGIWLFGSAVGLIGLIRRKISS